jgi:hypothetical protein
MVTFVISRLLTKNLLLRRSRRDDDIKKDVKETGRRSWTRITCLSAGIGGWIRKGGNKLAGFIKCGAFLSN